MVHFVGLDVSVKTTSVCVVDDAGKVILEQKVPTDPADIIAIDLARRELRPDRDRGWPAVAVAGQCVDGGQPAGDLRGDTAHEGFADGAANQQDGPQRCARDRTDDTGRPVQAGAREDAGCPGTADAADQPQAASTQAAGRGIRFARGTLRNFGLKVGVVGGSRYEARVRELVAGFPRLTAIAEPLLIVRRVRDYQEFRARRAVETIRPWRL
jgi:transposase